MRTRIRTTIAATAGLALAGVGLAAPTRAAAPDACEGRGSDCTIVSRADIDGDSQADSTGISARVLDNGLERVTVRTHTADGERLSTYTDSERRMGGEERHRGTARIDGVRGYELVIVDELGAHTAYNRVLTYRDGRLTTLKDPYHQWRWVTDGSVWSSAGYHRVDESSLGVQMFVSNATDNDGDGRFDQTLLRSRWAGDHWTKVTKIQRDVRPSTLEVYRGWNIHWMSPGI